MFIRNCWYVAAWDTEIGRTPLPRRILGEDVVLYRTEDGAPVALEDRCCHRNLPLSHGRIEGDHLRCGYHGLMFDASGACIEVPGQTAIPPGAEIRSYPLVERRQWIWIWMGDPARADPAAIPDWDCMDSPEWACAPGNARTPLAIACNYELANDNLLDLTHVAYVHESSLGSPGLADFPVETERHEDRVVMRRWAYDIEPPPLFTKYCDLADTIDRWQSSEMQAPCHCLVDVGYLPTGSGAKGRVNAPAPSLRVPISTTPETERSSLMFFCQTRNFAVDDPELTKVFQRDFLEVFHQDVAVLEAQQRVFDERPDASTVDINVDAPTIAMRAVNRRLLDRERTAETATA